MDLARRPNLVVDRRTQKRRQNAKKQELAVLTGPRGALTILRPDSTLMLEQPPLQRPTHNHKRSSTHFLTVTVTGSGCGLAVRSARHPTSNVTSEIQDRLLGRDRSLTASAMREAVRRVRSRARGTRASAQRPSRAVSAIAIGGAGAATAARSPRGRCGWNCNWGPGGCAGIGIGCRVSMRCVLGVRDITARDPAARVLRRVKTFAWASVRSHGR